MLSETNLRELLDFTATAPVLSVYLNTEPSEGNADAYRLRLRSMLKDVNLPLDVEAIDKYFQHEYNWAGKGVAVFSCAPQGFFRAYSLALPVQNLVHVGTRPSVRPLADLFDNYGGYGVALIDKQGARLFFFHLGELREQNGVLGEEVRKIKHGSASTITGQRGGMAGKTSHEDELVDRNIKETVDFAVRFFEENHVRRILIGGTDENAALLRTHLPKAWQSLVVGAFAMPMTATHTEVLAKTLQIGRDAEMQREAQMVSDMITSAAKQVGAVVGLNATLDAVNTSRVQRLVLSEGYTHSGYHCPACGALVARSAPACPQCGAALAPALDVVDMAVSAVLRSGGDVEVVRKNAELDQGGKIGALLRY
jgi:peptide subunit release factor 1 (eRF1)